MKIIAYSSKSAFTLVEIMIVVAIIGVLMAIATPNFMLVRETAIRNTCLVNIKQMEDALMRAALDTNVPVRNLSEDGIKAIVEPDYIRHMPHCKSGTYSTDGLENVRCSVHLPTGGAAS